ncbi:MAG: NAD(P)/FAD-dependent oxidoreductase, partial [Dehalococcoidia bacterium]
MFESNTMAREWDAIVIGSGVGGLTAAAKLVQTGKRIAVLERNSHPGGTAYVYRRKQFNFPMGPLSYSNTGIVGDILEDLNTGRELTYQRVHYRLKAFGLDILLSTPFAEITGQLARHFPEESPAIDRLFKDVEKMISLFRGPNGNTSSNEITNLTRNSAADYLHYHIQDWRLHRILGSIGTMEPYISFPLLASMWNLMSKEGIWYPEEGMKSLCNKLVFAVTGYNISDLPQQSEDKEENEHRATGLIKLHAEVKNIRIDKGRVTGVQLSDGSVLSSNSVISNADYQTTFLKLMSVSDMPPDWYHAISEARQTGSIVQLCLGVNSSAIDLSAFRDARSLIYRRDGDSKHEPGAELKSHKANPEAFANQEIEVSLWSKNDKNLSPAGTDVLVIRTEAPYSHFSEYYLGKGKRSPTYQDYKNEIAHTLINAIKYLIPGLENSIVVMDVATPLTLQDQGGRSEGAVAGWSWDYEDSQDHRPRELILTPIKGLYMAGYQAFSTLFMGGVPTAMESGRRAARAVLDNADPIKDIIIPGFNT